MADYSLRTLELTDVSRLGSRGDPSAFCPRQFAAECGAGEQWNRLCLADAGWSGTGYSEYPAPRNG